MIRIITFVIALSLCLAQLAVAQETKFPPFRLELRVAQYEPGEGLIKMTSENSPITAYVQKKSLISNEDILSAESVEIKNLQQRIDAIRNAGIGGVPDMREAFEINLTFTAAGAERMAAATGNGRTELAILFDGKLASVVTVTAKITDKASLNKGGLGFSREEANRMVASFNKK